MTQILAVAFVVVLGCWLHMMWPYFTRWVVRNNVRYSHSGIVDLPAASARQALDRFFQLSACTFELEKDGVRTYHRGCPVIFRADHTVKSSMIPHLVGFGLASELDKTKVELGYRVMPNVRITEAATTQFLEFARFESTRVLEILQSMACQGEAA